MIERLKFVGTVVCWYVGLLFCLTMLAIMRAGQTEHARMNEMFVPTPYDQVLEAAVWILVAPLLLLANIFVSQWPQTNRSNWLGLGLSLFIYATILYCGRVWFEKLTRR